MNPHCQKYIFRRDNYPFLCSSWNFLHHLFAQAQKWTTSYFYSIPNGLVILYCLNEYALHIIYKKLSRSTYHSYGTSIQKNLFCNVQLILPSKGDLLVSQIYQRKEMTKKDYVPSILSL